MTTYKGINGFAVQSVASDPSPLDEGQVWYNNATYAFKLAAATTVGTWASGGALNTARRIGGSHGTSVGNAMVSSGINSAGSQITSTEEYVDISAVAKTVTTS